MSQNEFVQLITPCKERKLKLKTKISYLKLLSIVVSVVVLLVVGIFVYCSDPNKKQNLGTHDNPEIAFRETQKALGLLSKKVNIGIESVYHIKEYQNSKELIFKQ